MKNSVNLAAIVKGSADKAYHIIVATDQNATLITGRIEREIGKNKQTLI